MNLSSFFSELNAQGIQGWRGLFDCGVARSAGGLDRISRLRCAAVGSSHFILIALLGFPIAVVMAWVFDITREGVKLDSQASGSKGLFAAAAVLIVLALGWYFYGQPSFRKGDVTTPAVADRNSIAVLPFTNISGKADEDYFSDGMTEELLNVLAKVPQLKVVARTSVFQFKAKGGDIREIGRKLGVTNIVEGSVRRDGPEVRITAQLVRVADGFHIWSETYDRKLERVFALQMEIAQRIGAALKVSLGVAAPVASRAPIDPEAYDEYLKGRALLRQRQDLPAAIAHFKKAVAKAPEFAAAWSSLSLTYEVSFWYTAHATAAFQTELLAGEKQRPNARPRLSPTQPPPNTRSATLPAPNSSTLWPKDIICARCKSIQATRTCARITRTLYEVGRMEDSLLATGQLVKTRSLLCRRLGAEEGCRERARPARRRRESRLQRIALNHFRNLGRQDRASQLRTRLRTLRRGAGRACGNRDTVAKGLCVLRKRCCRGRSANPRSIQLNCARRSRIRQKGESEQVFYRAPRHRRLQRRYREAGSDTPGLLLRQSL